MYWRISPFVLLDTETGYRSQYLQQSFLIQL